MKQINDIDNNNNTVDTNKCTELKCLLMCFIKLCNIITQ